MKNKELFFHLPCGRVYRAVVRGHTVALQDGACNNQLFDDLGIVNRHCYASRHYGYTTTDGNWPAFREGDYAALQRLFDDLCSTYGVKIRLTGATQKKHIDKNPSTYASPCKPAPTERKKPAAQPCPPADKDGGYVSSFQSPLASFQCPKW